MTVEEAIELIFTRLCDVYTRNQESPVQMGGPLDLRAPRAETDPVGCPGAVAMLLNHLTNGPGHGAEHHGRAPRYASSRLPSFRLLGRGVFRPLSTARS
jgi:hypothetical protein